MLILKTMLLGKIESFKEAQSNGYWYLTDALILASLAAIDSLLAGDKTGYNNIKEINNSYKFLTYEMIIKALSSCNKLDEKYNENIKTTYKDLKQNNIHKFHSLSNYALRQANNTVNKYKDISVYDSANIKLDGRFTVAISSQYLDMFGME